MTMQIGRLVALISEPGLFEENRQGRYIKNFGNYSLVGIGMHYVGGNGGKIYVAVFTNERPTLVGMVVPPEWVEFDLADAFIKGNILTINAFDKSGEPPNNGKPEVLRYAIEDVNSWGLRYLPEIKKSLKQRKDAQ